MSTDSILLAHFFELQKHAHIADFGCGSGILGLLLKSKESSVRITNIDLQDNVLEVARQNMAVNGLENGTEYYCADFQDLRKIFPASYFDGIICNPPYFDVCRGAVSPKQGRDRERSEMMCSLDKLVLSASRHLRSGGRICLVYRPDRLCELMETMRIYRIEPKRIRFVQHSIAHRPGSLLIEGRLNGNPGLQVEPSLILHHPDGTLTEEAKQIYHQI